MKKTLAEAKADDRAVRRYLRRMQPKSNPELVEALGAMGSLPKVTNDSGQPNPAVIAEHLRHNSGGDEIILLVADCLDPAVKNKPWRLDFHRGRFRKSFHRPLNAISFDIAQSVRVS